MKRESIFLIVVISFLMFSCVGGSKPENTVKECWVFLSNGDCEQAVRCFDIEDSEFDIYSSMFSEKLPIVEEWGGVEEVIIISQTENENSAEVEAQINFKSGKTITQKYNLTKRNKEWKINNN